MDSLKILILCQHFYPELVSTGQTLTELAETLRDMGVDVEVCCGPPTILGLKRKRSNVSQHKNSSGLGTFFQRFRHGQTGQSDYLYNFNILPAFQRDRTLVLVVTNPPFLVFICAVLHKIKHLRFIYLIFDVYPDTAINLEY